MMREFKVEANVGKPQVAYRETIRKEAEQGRGPLRPPDRRLGPVRPRRASTSSPNPGEGFEFVDKIEGGSIPNEFIPAVEKGIVEALASGVKAGYPMVDVKVELIDGSYHDVDSSEMAFKIAGSMAIQEARQARQAGAARAGDGGRGRHARGVPRRRDRRPLPASRQGRGSGAARQRAGRQRDAFRSARCSATSTICAPRPRVARPTRCSSTATKRCPRTSPRRSSRARPERRREPGA